MDKQDLSRQIKDFIHALASLDDEDAQKLADCFQSLVQCKRTEEMRAANAQPDKRPNAVESRCVEERSKADASRRGTVALSAGKAKNRFAG